MTESQPEGVPERRQRWVIQARKRRFVDRDVAHAHITAADPAGFTSVVGADCPDDCPHHPVGATVTYAVELDGQGEADFRAAANLLGMHPETYSHIPADPRPVAAISGREALEEHLTLPAGMLEGGRR